MSKGKVPTPVIAGLDIGSTKVALVIGIPTTDGKIEVVGVGSAPNTGIRQGAVVNIEAATESIRKAREEAELMSGYKIESVWVGVSGPHIKSFDSRGMVAIKNKEVSPEDIDRVIEAAKAVAVPSDRSVLHVLPREYKVDEQDQILDPIGMSGVRLESSVHIVTGSQTSVLNTIKCTEKAELKVAGLVLDQLAAAQAVLSDDEKNLGVCLVDIGGGTCNTLYYANGSVAHTSMIPVGGQHFSHDVAVGLRTPQSSAEDLKKKYGCALVSLVNESETIEVEGVGGRKPRTVLRRELAEVLEPRAEETLNLILADIQRSGNHHQLGSGVVLTGGASQLDGLIEMGEFIFDIPVRRGMPHKVGGLTDVVKSSTYATSVGLLLYGYEVEKRKMKGQGLDENFNQSLNEFGKKIRNFFGQAF
ncbi:MAG: cell division protein FtsA [Pseudobdellovibrionaceae bacterium]